MISKSLVLLTGKVLQLCFEMDYLQANIPDDVAYRIALRINKLAFLQITNNVFALLDWKKKGGNGQLHYKYVILQRSLSQANATYCNCQRVDCINVHDIQDEQFTCSCLVENCIHVSEIKTLVPPTDLQVLEGLDTFEYEFLTSSLIAVYCIADNSYSILSQAQKELRCLKCQNGVKNCIHVKSFKQQMPHDAPTLTTPQIFTCITTDPIPYIFQNAEDSEKYVGYASGTKAYPTELIPIYSRKKKCEHGYRYSKIPELLTNNARILLAHTTIKDRKLFCRTSEGDCNCKQYYQVNSKG